VITTLPRQSSFKYTHTTSWKLTETVSNFFSSTIDLRNVGEHHWCKITRHRLLTEVFCFHAATELWHMFVHWQNNENMIKLIIKQANRGTSHSSHGNVPIYLHPVGQLIFRRKMHDFVQLGIKYSVRSIYPRRFNQLHNTVNCPGRQTQSGLRWSTSNGVSQFWLGIVQSHDRKIQSFRHE
jgi:hypothetical protein